MRLRAYCTRCQRGNAPGSRFCVHCGSPMRDPPGAHTTEVGWVEYPTVYLTLMRGFKTAIERGGTMLRNFMNRLEATDDLAHGQVVIIAARWILVVAGLVLTLWDPAPMGKLQAQIMLILGLAVANFFLQTHILKPRGQPLPTWVTYLASAADILVISLIIIIQGGFSSEVYVFYLPAILAISVAFRTPVAATFAGAAAATYGLISITTLGSGDGVMVLTRLLMFAAVFFCGNLYRRIEDDRRHAAEKAREALKPRARPRTSTPPSRRRAAPVPSEAEGTETSEVLRTRLGGERLAR